MVIHMERADRRAGLELSEGEIHESHERDRLKSGENPKGDVLWHEVRIWETKFIIS